MKKINILILLLIASLCSYSQTASTGVQNIKTINIIHQYSKSHSIINPGGASEKGIGEIVYEFWGDPYPEEKLTSYSMDTCEYNGLLSDKDTNIIDIKEIAPPKGYFPSKQREVYYYKKFDNGEVKRVGYKVLQSNQPVIWERDKADYLTIIFINEKAPQQVQKEEFHYRFVGGQAWKGNSKEQPIAEKISTIRVSEYYWMQDNFNIWVFSYNTLNVNCVARNDGRMTNYFPRVLANISIMLSRIKYEI